MTPTTTGVPGLDHVLLGGLVGERTYLLEGSPGTGKTTLAMQFLIDGVRQGEATLYITLSETCDELRSSARAHGWALEGIEIREYIITDASIERDREVTMFHSAEVELGDTLTRILQDIATLKPKRLVIDALSEFRLLSDSVLRYRRQLLALKKFFSENRCTVLVLDDRSDVERDSHVESIVHGVIALDHHLTEYGADRRRLRVRKLRGKAFQSGLHDYTIRTGGLEVFPRLVAQDHHSEFVRTPLPSGIAELDRLSGGGPQAGTSTLLIGPAGSGKTTVAMQYAVASAKRGMRAAIYMFDELRGLLVDRLVHVGLEMRPLIEKGDLLVTQIDPTQMAPGEFAAQVRQDVESRDTKVVVIDSLNGYLNSMPHEKFLAPQLHELLAYLGNRGVTTFLVVAQHGIVGAGMQTPVDASYLADSVMLFRFFESGGRVRKAISVTKKRGGGHENTIRELTIDGGGVRLGSPLAEFHGVLTGVPQRQREEAS
jgi:circadian clock protein KaiC